MSYRMVTLFGKRHHEWMRPLNQNAAAGRNVLLTAEAAKGRLPSLSEVTDSI